MEVRWVGGGEDLSDAYAVRMEVFVEEQKVPPEIEIDDLDATAEHLLLYDNGYPIATGRIVCISGVWMIGRVAVRKEWRGTGFGDYIVREMMQRIFDKGAREIHIHAQIGVRGFYERLGFIPYGDSFEEAGIEHVCMKAVR